MTFLRLLLAALVGLLLRRVYLSIKDARKSQQATRPNDFQSGKPNADRAPGEAGVDELTQQDISDADFEEIP